MLRFKAFLEESKWSKALYHSTGAQFDPKKIKTGSHFGDLNTAVTNGVQINMHSNRPDVLAYDYKPSGKSVRVIDDWGGNVPERNIAQQLGDRKVIDTKIAKFIRLKTKYPQRAMMKALRAKHISTVKYRNDCEGEGTDSTIVYDPENLSPIHTFKRPKIITPKDVFDKDEWEKASYRRNRFGKEGRKVNEENPLARVDHFEREGRATAGITAWRAGLSKSENRKRMKAFDKELRSLGYGFRKSEGSWEGNHEDSRFVTAKGKGKKAEHQFRGDMTKLAAKYNQDAVAIRRKHKTILQGTNNTGYPGKGKVVNVGRTVYNDHDAQFKTEFQPSRPEKIRPTITTHESTELTEAKKKSAKKPLSYFYHLTLGKNMNSIADSGLLRNGGGHAKKNYDFSRHANYLASSPKKALYFANDLGNPYLAPKRSLRVIRIAKDKIDKKKLHKDRNMGIGKGYYEYGDDIPVKDITFTKGLHLKKKSKAWKKAIEDSYDENI